MFLGGRVFNRHWILCSLVSAALVIFLSFSSITHNFEPDMRGETLVAARLLRLQREYASMKREASERFEALDKKVSDSLDVARLRTLEIEYKSLKRGAEALDKRVSDLSDSGRSISSDAVERFEALDKRVSDGPDAAGLLALESKYKSLKRDVEALDKRVSDHSDGGRSINRDALERVDALDKRVSDSPDAARPDFEK